MNWNEYEIEVYKYFSEQYPGSKISFDVKISGRYSKKPRQVDILIEDEIAGELFKIAVDTKYFSRNVDVKCVEAFASMVQDIDASHGLLITHKGYSDAAINRAHYGPEKVELDVLNFDELLKNQGLEAFPYTGENSILISAPFGWIVDNTKVNDYLASMYQRGLDLRQAQEQLEWMYVNFWTKDDSAASIHALTSMQNAMMHEVYTNLKISSEKSPEREDGCNTFIRVAEFDEFKGLEITGFIDCGDYIVFIVLFTKKELIARNLRKLRQVLKYSSPAKINFENSLAIKSLKNKLESISDPHDKALAYNQIAEWYSEMKNIEDELENRRLCWETYPEIYQNIRPLIRVELLSGNVESAIGLSIQFFALAPTNPKTMQDILSIFYTKDYKKHLIIIVSRLKEEYENQLEAFGNICFHNAIFLFNEGDTKNARTEFRIAKSIFEDVDENHYVIEEIEHVLLELE